ncbi:hypothetical protein [Streptomyces sp. NPDC048442]|uniref:hypothetical protein n=1 Tax=Streptomyces sp. NPDC048442 TaxID=3154823 RepID=UPI0034179369
MAGCRLLLASDGAYEPFHGFALEEEFGRALAVPGPADAVPLLLLDAAARWAPDRADHASVLVTGLPGGRGRHPVRR